MNKLQRLLEIAWGMLPFIFLGLIVFLSFYDLTAAAVILLIFTVAWFIRLIGYAYRLVLSFIRYRFACRIDWKAKLVSLNAELQEPPSQKIGFWQRQSEKWYLRLKLKTSTAAKPIDPSRIYQAIIITLYLEPAALIESSIKALLASDYELSKLILIIAFEERGGSAARKTAEQLVKRYGTKLKLAVAVQHPKNINGEVKAKAGNITYAAKWLSEYCRKEHINPSDVLVTTLDADNKPHPQYLAELAWTYSLTAERTTHSYQPIPLFTNNIWDASAPIRVIAADISFWFMMEQSRPRRLRLFSAYAQSLKTLEDVKYWNVKSVVEDGHQYWRSYLAFGGNHKVLPIWLPIYQDAVISSTLYSAMREQLRQLLRWAWGTADTPYLMLQALSHKNIGWTNKLVHIYRQVDDYISWATTPLILAIGAWLPWLLRNDVSGSTDLAFKLFHVIVGLQLLAFGDLLIGISIYKALLPKRPNKYSFTRSLAMILQWILEPILLVIFISGTSLSAHFRLIIGKKLEVFHATSKTYSG
jgi:cytochrome b561